MAVIRHYRCSQCRIGPADASVAQLACRARLLSHGPGARRAGGAPRPQCRPASPARGPSCGHVPYHMPTQGAPWSARRSHGRSSNQRPALRQAPPLSGARAHTPAYRILIPSHALSAPAEWPLAWGGRYLGEEATELSKKVSYFS